MGVAAPQAPVDGWGPRPLKSLVISPSLLGNCYHKKQGECANYLWSLTGKYIRDN